MRFWAVVVTVFGTVTLAHGQDGRFTFENPQARFVLCTDPPGTSSVGTNFQVQLFGGSLGTPLEQLQPTVPPSTTFQGPAGSSGAGYVVPIIATALGTGTVPARVYIRVFDGPSWDTATMRFEQAYDALSLDLTGSPTPPDLPLGSSFAVPATLTNLVTLNLANNSLMNLSFPAAMAGLQQLNLSSSWVIAHLPDQSFLTQLPALRDLNFDGTVLGTLIVPASLTHLTTLEADGSQLTEVSVPAGLSQLRKLDLGANQLTNVFLPSSLVALENVLLTFNPLQTLAMPAVPNMSPDFSTLQSSGVQLTLWPRLALAQPSSQGLLTFNIFANSGVVTLLRSGDLKNWTKAGEITLTNLNPLGTVLILGGETSATAGFFKLER